MLSPEINRRELLQIITILLPAVFLNPSIVISQRSSVVPVESLGHGIGVGFSYANGAEEHGGVNDEWLYSELCRMFETPNLSQPIPNWVRLSWRQSNRDIDNLRALDFQYRLAEKYHLDRYQMVGTDQCFGNNFYPRNDLAGLSTNDPHYISECQKENERSFSVMAKEGFIDQAKYLIIGNESRNVFNTRPIPLSTTDTLKKLNKLAKEAGKETVMNDFCSYGDRPRDSWREILSIADYGALDIYSQTYTDRVHLVSTLVNFDNFLSQSQGRFFGVLEGQLKRWDNLLSIFSPVDQQNLFYSVARFVQRYGFWDTGVVIVLGYKADIKGLRQSIKQAALWNERLAA